MTAPYTILLDEELPAPSASGDGSGAPGVHLIAADVSPLLADEALCRDLVPHLSPYRRGKAEACGNPRVRALSTGAALVLDRLLASIGLHEAEMRYAEGPHGKPVFAQPDGRPDPAAPAFNLSHSGRMVAAALLLPPRAPQAPGIGVDIQRISRFRPELVRRVFSKDIIHELGACTDAASRDRRLFTHHWCRAEAYAKATGDGLRWPFAPAPANAVFHDFAIHDDYLLSLCLLPQNETP